MKQLVILTVLVTLCFAADFEYSTTGSMYTTPTVGGSSDGWGEWFITAIENNTGQPLLLTQLSVPCGGPASGDYGWVVWVDVGGLNAPSGNATTADHYGAFTPVESNPDDYSTYTDIDLSSANVIIPAGNFFAIGYDNTGIGGQISYNGVETWSWYENAWDPDQGWSRTAIIDVYADYATALERNSWGAIKSSF